MDYRMKLQIAGYGFVGMAHALSLEGDDVKTYIYDPKKGYGNWCKDMDAIIICVSTPMAPEGSCDMSNVYSIIEDVPADVPILIKSTISLEGWRLIKRVYPWRSITFSPEFLRAAHAMEDFKNQKVVYLGGSDPSFWINLISNKLNVIVEVADAEELILAKYLRNSFLATKVAFFNQIYDLCERLNIEYSAVAHYVTEDPRIGDSHSFVNPNDRGFGGHCFPKDTSAIVETAKHFGYDFSILREAIEYNESIHRAISK
jgi:UDPglucose 6-dehydrogenase